MDLEEGDLECDYVCDLDINMNVTSTSKKPFPFECFMDVDTGTAIPVSTVTTRIKARDVTQSEIGLHHMSENKTC